MSSRDCFSKVLPNIKLATRFDADGKEIQVFNNLKIIINENGTFSPSYDSTMNEFCEIGRTISPICVACLLPQCDPFEMRMPEYRLI